MFWKQEVKTAVPETGPFDLPLGYATFLLGRLPWKCLEKSLRGCHAELPQDLWPGVTVLGRFEICSNPKIVWVVGDTEVASQSYPDLPGLKAHIFLPEISVAMSAEERVERALPVLEDVYRMALEASIDEHELDICNVVANLLRRSRVLGDTWTKFWPQIEKSKFLPGASGEFYSPEQLHRHDGLIFIVTHSTPKETIRRGRSLGAVCLEDFTGLRDVLKYYDVPWEAQLKKLKSLAAEAGPIVPKEGRDSAVELFFERATFQDGKLTLIAGRPGGCLVIDYSEGTISGPRSRDGGEAKLSFSEIVSVGLDEENYQRDLSDLTKFFLRIATKKFAVTYQVHFSFPFGVYEGMGEDLRRDDWAKGVLHAIPGSLTTNVRIACPQYIPSEPFHRLFDNVPPGRKGEH